MPVLYTRSLMALVLLLCLSRGFVRGDDWPMRMHDIGRSGVTSEALSVPLSQAWTRTTRRAPAPAWAESPARHDYLHNYYDMKPRQAFDRCFDVAVADGRVYFGSSQSGAVSCLSAADNGKVIWTFFTDAPVRFAPQVVGERLYVGSDDGVVYCLDARSGTLVWKERAGATSEMLWGNGHMISLWPVRTGVLVVDDHVYWTAGLFPEQGITLCRRKASDGSGGWKQALRRPAQGYLLASSDRLFVPTGKTSPLVCDLLTGAPLGDVKKSTRDGGSWALVDRKGNRVWSGPSTDNTLQGFDRATGARIASVRGANCLVVDGEYAFYTTNSRVVKIDSSGRKTIWSRTAAFPHALIKAGSLIFVGGTGRVAAFGTDGSQLWEAPVDGRAFGLAVADGCLYVSTDTGSIHCFKATLPRLLDVAQEARVGDGSVDISGHLDSIGGAPTTVALHWGRTDGGTDPKAWQTCMELGQRTAGAFTVKLEALQPNVTYYWRTAATNSYGTTWEKASSALNTGRVTVTATDATASEHGLDPGTFTISRNSPDIRTALTVRYNTSGTATMGTDYSTLSGEVVLAAGSRAATVTVRPCADLLLDEPEKTVTITLSPGAYGIGAENTARITLSDRDSMAAWQHKAKLTVAGYRDGKPLQGFPALLHVDERIPGFRWDQLVEGGHDLRFTDADASVALPYEVEAWAPGKTARVWVRTPDLTPTTSIWIWWGNPACTSPPPYSTDGSTWGPDHVGVWHMGGVPDQVRDSSPAANHGQGKALGQAVPGVIGTGIHFDGEKGAAKLTSILPIGKTDNTVSLWLNVPKPGTEGLGLKERVGIILGNFGDKPNSNWELHATGEMRWHWDRGRPDLRGKIDLRDGSWHHLAWVRERQSDTLRIYVDGKLGNECSGSGADITFTTRHAIGADNRGKGSPHFHGKMDELRISQSARSADWIRASAANQSSPDSFWSVDPAPPPGQRD